jgi:hypothetical protein
MALSFPTDAGVLIIPGAYAQTKVERSSAGLSTVGVLAVIGEADQGPDFTKEEDLQENAFGPDQLAEIVAKYGSGPLVDACREAMAAANDPDIQGAFQRIVLVKTNVSAAASSSLTNWGGDSMDLVARMPGKPGNLISRTVEAVTEEDPPTSGPFTFAPPTVATDISIRLTGSSSLLYSIAADEMPDTFVAGVGALAGVAATGGVNRGIITVVAGTLALAVVSGFDVTVTKSTAWTTTPSVGDLMYIPTGSVIEGGSSQNAGSYVVTAATSTVISATKLLDADGAVGNEKTAPVAVGAVAITSTTADLVAYSPVTITNDESPTPYDGVGKSMEVNELTTATGRFTYNAYALTDEPVDWISTAAAPTVIYSASEYVPMLTVSRQLDSITEELTAGGPVVLRLGYEGTDGTVVIADGVMTITVVGGAGSSPDPITLADFGTIADLAAYLSTLTGFTASAGTAVLGQQPATSLDETAGTGIGTTYGAKTGGIKQDAYRFFKRVQESVLVQLNDPEAQEAAGVPQPAAAAFLSGGTRGATADADVLAACVALEAVRLNFVVPLFSNDAADDVADGLTDSGSTYTIDGVNANVKSHVLSMSTLKKRRNRQAFLSHRGDFDSDKEAASNVASFRCSMTFQDARTPNSVGTVVQQRPWMFAVKAAAMQAAGFYRSIMRKGINVSGAVHADGSFNPNSDSAVEDALLSGLLPVRKDEGGGFVWVSDQTTYGKDDNFVFNSVQAVYGADTVALTAATRMEKAIVGQSVADVGASVGLTVLEGIFEDLRRLKLIAASDDAPKGFRNAKIQVRGNTMIVQAEVKLATAIAFVPITFQITQVQQSA